MRGSRGRLGRYEIEHLQQSRNAVQNWNLTLITRDTLAAIAQAVVQVPQVDSNELQALVVQELRRLHEGVVARYGLRPSELAVWKAARHQSL